MPESPALSAAVPVLYPPPRPHGEPGQPRSHDWGPVLAWLEGGRGFLLTTHVNPDADGLGSLAALALTLRRRGRRVDVLLPSAMPEVCRFLFEGFDGELREGPAALAGADLEGLDRAVVLDVSGRARIGAVAELIERRALPVLILDHHLASETDGALAAVFPGLSSTGEVLGGLLGAWGEAPAPAEAQALYAALSSDTGGFNFSSTTGDTLELAAALVRAGARPERVHAQLEQNYPAARYDLMARFLATRRAHAGGRLLDFELTRAMLAQTGASRDDSEGFPNLGLAIRNCQMTVLLCELEEGQVKLNLRCVAPHDVCAIARELGGGGHRYAAGATLRGEIAELRPRVLELALAQVEQGEG